MRRQKSTFYDCIARDVQRGDFTSALDQVLYLHAVWLSSGGTQGKKLDISETYLNKPGLHWAGKVLLEAGFSFRGGNPIEDAKRPSEHTESPQRRRHVSRKDL
jgi:hypothetical protein